MIDIFIWLLAFVAISFATITDLKTREVPDYLNAFIFVAFLLLRLLQATIENNWSLLLYSGFWMIVYFVLSAVLFYTGQWGGGDAKHLIPLALVFVQYPHNPFFTPNLTIPTASIFLMNLLFGGIIYTIVGATVLILRYKKQFAKKLKENTKKYRILMIPIALIGLLTVAASFFLTQQMLAITFILLGAMLLLMPILFLVSKAIEQGCMIRFMNTEDLTEGEWIVDDIIIDGKKICGPKDLGIDKKQIAQLKKHKIDKVKVKIGIPFVPAFWLAFIFTVVWGNMVPMIVQWLI